MAEIIKQNPQVNRTNLTKKVNFSITSQPPKANFSSLQKIILLTLIINISCIAIIFFLRSHLPPQVPLFYGLAEGESQLVPLLGLTIPSVISLCIVIVNALLSAITQNQFIKQILIYTGLAVTLLSIITTFKIVLLVGNI